MRAWNRFWFTPQPAATMCALRVMFGVVVLAWGLALLVDLESFFMSSRVLPPTTYSANRLGVLRFWDGDVAVIVVYLALMVGALAMVFGRWLRLAAPVTWLAFMSLGLDAPAIDNAGDQLLRIWAAYLAIYALLTPSPLWSASPLRRGGQFSLAPTWVVRMFQLQLTVIYVATIVEKLPGETWRAGTAVYYAFALDDFARFPVPNVLAGSLVLSNILTWLTVALELSLPFLLWTRRTRRFAIVAGVGLHVGFDYALRVGFFLPAMAIGYVAFVRPEEVVAIAARVRRVFALPSERRRDGSEPGVESAGDGVVGLGAWPAAPHEEASAEQEHADEDRQREGADLVAAAAEQATGGQRRGAGDHEQVRDRDPGATSRHLLHADDADDAGSDDHDRPD